mmetsp:Transcript_110791/g.353017  ORF Transcript_110791/g.353017 Transcript_110791/m.353017 type:complete len:232 (+) Transcript_110791:431-1126(+)
MYTFDARIAPPSHVPPSLAHMVPFSVPSGVQHASRKVRISLSGQVLEQVTSPYRSPPPQPLRSQQTLCDMPQFVCVVTPTPRPLFTPSQAPNRASVGRSDAGGLLLQSRPSMAAHCPSKPGIGRPPGPLIGKVGNPPTTSTVAFWGMKPLHQTCTSSGTRLSGHDPNCSPNVDEGVHPGQVSASILGSKPPRTFVGSPAANPKPDATTMQAKQATMVKRAPAGGAERLPAS